MEFVIFVIDCIGKSGLINNIYLRKMVNQENIKKVLENLKEIERIMDKEFWDEFNKSNDSWEFHNICLILGFTKDILKAYSEPNGIEKANKTYKLIKG
jgi:hypothetical protein